MYLLAPQTAFKLYKLRDLYTLIAITIITAVKNDQIQAIKNTVQAYFMCYRGAELDTLDQFSL